jgi:uncharacterized DUF497 family protein
MAIEYELRGIRFRWNEDKAGLNAKKHDGVSFEQAAKYSLIHSFSIRMPREAAKSVKVYWVAILIFDCCL